MLAKVYVTPKKAILDPQGKAIAQSLHALDYAEVGEVRMGKYLEVRLTGPVETAGRAARRRDVPTPLGQPHH